MKVCSVPDCEGSNWAKSFCRKHYKNFIRTGNPVPQLRHKDADVRFYARVNKGESESDCWIWIGAHFETGYACFSPEPYVKVLAHRWIMKAPADKVVDHTCHVRNCVNPAHLQIVTVAENNQNQLICSTNTSGYRGVSWSKARSKWEAYAGFRGKKHSGGFFDDLEDAANAAKELRMNLHTNNLIDRGLNP